MLILVKPDIKYTNQYIEMLAEWAASGEEPEPWVLKEDYSDFPAMVQRFEDQSRGIGIPTGFVPSSTYWAYDDVSDKVVGAVNIRHTLNEFLLAAWGNIGYGVRPGQRRRGYATEILRQALNECRMLGIERVLLGCFKENIGSAKTIMNNGGVLENEIVLKGNDRKIQRYWITL